MSSREAQSSTRQRLLEAAITLFARQGYATTSIAEIQRACGLTPGSGALYRHFSCKRELLEVATRRYVDRLTEDRKRFDAEPTDNGQQVLARAATHMGRHRRQRAAAAGYLQGTHVSRTR